MKRATQLTLLELREPVPSAPHPPLVIDRKAKKRDQTIRAIGMDKTRAFLIEKATETALLIISAKGWCTSVDVMRAMRTHPELTSMLDACDGRFMGGVLLPSRGFVKLDYIGAGSKGRPIPRWTRKT